MIRPMLRYATLWLLGALALALIACGDPTPVIALDPTAPPTPATTSTAVPTSPPSATTTQAVIPTIEGEAVPRNPEVERLGTATMETLTFLTNELSPRASGTQEEAAAAEYLRDEFAAQGYDASIQPFEVAVDIAVRTAPDGGRAGNDGYPGVSDVDDRRGGSDRAGRRCGQGAA